MRESVNLIDFRETPFTLAIPLRHSRRLDVGDLDGDGFPDVVVASNLDNQITWFRNLDGDVFSVGGEIDTANPVDVQLVDLDGDGDLDLIYTSVLNGELSCGGPSIQESLN